MLKRAGGNEGKGIRYNFSCFEKEFGSPERDKCNLLSTFAVACVINGSTVFS